MCSSDLNIQKIHSCMEQVESSSQHLLGIINDILDYSKMESGKMLLDLSVFSLKHNLDFVISMMQTRAQDQGINLVLSADCIVNDTISTDSLRLNQVLINLLANAIKFSGEGSDVFLNVKEISYDNGYSTFRFEVVDHGIGISEYQASKLFKPFEQADGSITRNYGGTGLGLVISKTLVELLGGELNLVSKEGEGSTFSFIIQCASGMTAEIPSAGMEEVHDSVVYNFTGKRCLVVDDIGINRDIICELLSVTNISLETAKNGKEALDLFISRGASYYDIILMDMQMPIMDGCTATKGIRRIEKERQSAGMDIKAVPVVAMTANVLQEDIQKAINSGMNAHLGKPIELDITLKTLHEQIYRE